MTRWLSIDISCSVMERIANYIEMNDVALAVSWVSAGHMLKDSLLLQMAGLQECHLASVLGWLGSRKS